VNVDSLRQGVHRTHRWRLWPVVLLAVVMITFGGYTWYRAQAAATTHQATAVITGTDVSAQVTVKPSNNVVQTSNLQTLESAITCMVGVGGLGLGVYNATRGKDND